MKAVVPRIQILGGGLAGSEAALQVAKGGLSCTLYEMRPQQSTAAHKTGELAELVCSNSLKSETRDTAPWLLKEELRRAGSGLLKAAEIARVPGGQALTVDRDIFAAEVTATVQSLPGIGIRREEIGTIPSDGIV